MESFLDRILPPLVLIGCLYYVYAGFDSDPPEVMETVAFAPYVRESEAASPAQDAPRQFASYPCGDDCSEHRAGYAWGRDSGLSDPDNCEGRSAPFIEGCRVYVEEKAYAVAMTK